ncbi:DUF6192 family protein [Microbispora sp. NPDC004025]
MLGVRGRGRPGAADAARARLHRRGKGHRAGALGRVRATADWLEAAVESGDVSLDEGLARLLRGE